MERSTGVREALPRCCDRFSAGDVDACVRMTSRQRGSTVIGTDPGEWLGDRDAWAAGFAEPVQARPGVRLESDDPVCCQEGSVGWAADRARFVLPDGTAVPLHPTVVALGGAGEWRPVQARFSVGVPNDELLDLIGRWAGRAPPAAAVGLPF